MYLVIHRAIAHNLHSIEKSQAMRWIDGYIAASGAIPTEFSLRRSEAVAFRIRHCTDAQPIAVPHPANGIKILTACA